MNITILRSKITILPRTFTILCESLRLCTQSDCRDFPFSILVYNNGGYIVLDALTDNNPVMLVSYYAPNVETDQMKVLDEITHIFNKLEISKNTTIIWGSDFKLFKLMLKGDISVNLSS